MKSAAVRGLSSVIGCWTGGNYWCGMGVGLKLFSEVFGYYALYSSDLKVLSRSAKESSEGSEGYLKSV